MPPRKNEIETPEIHIGNAHRFMLPFPEVAGGLAMALACIQGGTVEAYRNNRTGGLLLGMTCPDCDKHHPLVEVHVIDEPLDENDRFIVQTRGCMPYGAFLEMSGGRPHQDTEAHQPSAALIASLEDPGREPQATSIEELHEELPAIVGEMMEGGATLALDLQTGRTAIGYECQDCKVIHGILALEMPKPQDMRSAEGYTYIGNPFLDLMLADAGEVRH